MRFLADVGISISTAEMLRAFRHDVSHLSEQGLHRLPDDQILALARREDRVILTFDLDFGDLLAAGPHRLPSAIIFRLRDQTPSSVKPRLLRVISEREEDLQAGALIIIEDNRYRLRRLPIQGLSRTDND